MMVRGRGEDQDEDPEEEPDLEPDPPEPYALIDLWMFQMTEEEEMRFRQYELLPHDRRWEPLDGDLDEHKMAQAVYSTARSRWWCYQW